MIFSKFIPKRFLGIDVGTTVVKAVELSKRGDRKKLENYGEMTVKALFEKPFRTFEKSALLLSAQDISFAIKAVLAEAKIKSRTCIFSIPDFSSFFTDFELPPMTKEELPKAVEYEARRHVPLPLGEVTLDWQVVAGGITPDQKKRKFKILLVAVPNDIINQYREIAGICNLELLALEAEVFGLMRSLVPSDNEKTISIVDIGAQSTTCSIVDKKALKVSHSFDIAGNELIAQIAKSMSVDYEAADDLKRKYGLKGISQDSAVKIEEVIVPLVDSILTEVGRITKDFSREEGKEIQKFILAGGTANLPGLKEYCKDYLKKEVEIGNPFSGIFCPPILEADLKEMGPAYAIAVGMALRGFE